MSILKSVLLWTFAVVFMVCIAVYQRMTGPTYPVKGSVSFGTQTIKSKLLTTSDSDGDTKITFQVPDTSYKGFYEYKRFKSHDDWTRLPLQREGDALTASLPHQPPAGKVIYQITVEKEGQQLKMSESPVVLRYKGKVPAWILIPHIIFMFLAMVFSTRAGLEVLFKGNKAFMISLWTAMFLFAGGLILGPLVQYHAFGAFWTGWPWGHDLTDNKTAVSLIAWIIAVVRVRKNPHHKGWVLAASIILLAIYLIPHSVLGSEIDYTTE